MPPLNFPNNPSAQNPINTFSPTSTPDATSNGVTYTYQGGKWYSYGESGAPGLPLTGGNLTGDLTIGTSKIVLGVNGNAAFEGKVTSASTTSGDSDETLATKDYVDANSEGNVISVNGDIGAVVITPDSIDALALAGGTMTGDIVFDAAQSFPGVLPLSGGTITGDVTYLSTTSNANNIQTRASVEALIADVSGGFTFKGDVDVTTAAPASPEAGDFYVSEAAGTMDASWTGIGGQSVLANQVIAYSESASRWFTGAVQDVTAYLLKSGGNMTGDLTLGTDKATLSASTGSLNLGPDKVTFDATDGSGVFDGSVITGGSLYVDSDSNYGLFKDGVTLKLKATSATFDFTNAGELLVPGQVRPKTDGDIDLGGSSNRWNNIYSEAGDFSGTITAGGLSSDGDLTTTGTITGGELASTNDISAANDISANGSGSFAGKVTSANTISTDPSTTLATKSYVDSLGPSGAIVSGVAPTTKINGDPLTSGDLWWDSNASLLYVYYINGGSGQWLPSADSGGDVTSVNGDTGAVIVSPASISALALAGGDLTGNLTLGSNKVVLNASNGNAAFNGKVTSALTVAGDSPDTLVTKDYVDDNTGGGSVISVLDYGADPTGVTDSTSAIQQAFDAAAGGIVYVPDGTYLINPSSGNLINLSNLKGSVRSDDPGGTAPSYYNYGISNMKACLMLAPGTRLSTAGYSTIFLFENPSSTTCGLAIGQDPDRWSHSSHTIIDPITFKVKGSDGLYGIVTPKDTKFTTPQGAKVGYYAIFANHRPWFDVSVQLLGWSQFDDKGIVDHQWSSGLVYGDTMGGSINVRGWGTYNATLVDSSSKKQTAVRVDAGIGAAQLKIRINVSNFRIGFFGGDGLEGCSIEDSEFQGVWYGVQIDSTTGEPGGFLSNCHINSNKTGVYIKNKLSFQISAVECYRSDAYHRHQESWYGIHLATSYDPGIPGDPNRPPTGFKDRYITISSCSIQVGTQHNRVGTAGIYMEWCLGIQVLGYSMIAVGDAFKISNSYDCSFGLGTLNAVSVVYNLIGAATKNIIGLSPTNQGSATTFIVEGADFNSLSTCLFPFEGTSPSPTPTEEFPSGTRMLFQQPSPPSGWTLNTNADNYALRIGSDNKASGAGSSFTAGFAPRVVPVSSSSTLNGSIQNTTLDTSKIPSHGHSANYRVGPSTPGNIGTGAPNNVKANLSGSTGDAGGGGSHSHGHSFTVSTSSSGSVDMTIKYVSACIGVKQ